MTGQKGGRNTPGIAALGAYVPRLALPTETYREAWGTGSPPGVDRTAVPDADEDSLTLAVEAAERALDAVDADPDLDADSDPNPDAIASLAFATTTPPVEEDETVVRLASLLGTPADARTREYGRSTRAGVAALSDALAGDLPTPALVVAADAPEGSPESDVEAAAGAGAGAVLVTDDGLLHAKGVGEHANPAPGTRFRRRGRAETESLGVAGYERGAYRTCVTAAVEAVTTVPAADETDDAGGDDDAAVLDAVALTAPNGKLPHRVSGGVPGLDAERIAAGTVVDRTGDAGVAGPLLGLANALSNGATDVLVVGYGGGAGATAVRLAACDDSVPVDAVIDPATDLDYAAYARRRGFVTGEPPAGGGANVSVPSWRRSLPQRHRLVAGRCVACDSLAFPPEGACNNCGSLDGYDEASLPGTGTVEAATTVGAAGAPPEFATFGRRAGEFGVAVVAFDGPGENGVRAENDAASVSVPVSVVADVSPPAVGDRVKAVPRRIYEQEGVVRYGRKVIPVDALRESV